MLLLGRPRKGARAQGHIFRSYTNPVVRRCDVESRCRNGLSRECCHSICMHLTDIRRRRVRYRGEVGLIQGLLPGEHQRGIRGVRVVADQSPDWGVCIKLLTNQAGAYMKGNPSCFTRCTSEIQREYDHSSLSLVCSHMYLNRTGWSHILRI